MMRNLSPFWAWGEGSSGDSSGQLYGRLKQNHGKWWNCITSLDNWSARCILKDLPQKLLPGLCSHSYIASNFKPNYCLKILHLCAFSGHSHCLFFLFLKYFFHMKQAAHCAKIPFELNTSLIRSRASHLNACICMGLHAHSSIICTHNNLDVSHTLGQVWAKILCPTPTPMCRLVLCEYIFHPDIYPLGMDIIFICIYNLFFSN